MPWTILLFVLFGGMAVGCAVAMVAQRNPLYSAISLVGVFVSLACLYVVLAAPFIAAVQVIVYAGAIMVLVVFVIMLLNVEEEARRPLRRRYLIGIGLLLGALLIAETAFMLSLRGRGGRPDAPLASSQSVGTTKSIGAGLFTEYLLPFEVTSVLILMALVGAITLARQHRAETEALAGDDYAVTLPAGADLPRAGAVLQPGQTEATGRAYAELQIERGEGARGESERGQKG